MQSADSSFDVACGKGILHHLRIEKALGELTRVLKPEGKAIFLEPMGYNPAINTFRKLTPRLRTENEHPLTRKDLELIEKYFGQTNHSFFNLSSLLAVPFRNTRKFSSILEALDSIDRSLFKWAPFLRWMAWQVVITLNKPRKPATW